MPISITLVGATGKVGKALAVAIHQAQDLQLTAAVSRNAAGASLATVVPGAPDVEVFATLEEALRIQSDVVVDFTQPAAVKGHALLALASDRHVVIGTSGLGQGDYVEVDGAAVAARRGAMAAGNYSITATLLRRFSLAAAKFIPDVEIIDYGPGSKVDVPSGTARELAEGLSAGRVGSSSLPLGRLTGLPATRGAQVGEGSPVHVHSVRIPSYALSCDVIFGGDNERLTIRHDAGPSAAPYVSGTLLAARSVGGWIGLRRGLDTLLE